MCRLQPGGTLLATGGKDQNVMLWANPPARPDSELPNDNDFPPVVSADGKQLVTVDPVSKKSWLWSTAGTKMAGGVIPIGGKIVGFSTDGKCLASFDSDHVSLQFRLPDGTAPVRVVPLYFTASEKPRFVFAGMSPDQSRFFAIDQAGLIHVWKTETGGLLANDVKGPLAAHSECRAFAVE